MPSPETSPVPSPTRQALTPFTSLVHFQQSSIPVFNEVDKENVPLMPLKTRAPLKIDSPASYRGRTVTSGQPHTTLKGKNFTSLITPEGSESSGSDSEEDGFSLRLRKSRELGLSELKPQKLFDSDEDMMEDGLPGSPDSLNDGDVAVNLFGVTPPPQTPRTPLKRSCDELEELAKKIVALHSPSKDTPRPMPVQRQTVSFEFAIPAAPKRSLREKASTITPANQVKALPQTPDTPFKKITKPRETPGVVGNILRVLDNLGSSLKTQSGTGVYFELGKCIGNGDHSNVYQVSGNLPIFEGYANEELLVKCYQRKLIDKNTIRQIESFVVTALTQYVELLTINFPVAKILNAATIKDDGFFVVENIPYAFNIPDELDLDNLPEDHPMTQVKTMFQIAFDQKIGLDLSRDNVRIKADGTVVLTDFIECSEEFELILFKLLKTFSQNSREIFDYLKPVGSTVEFRDDRAL